MSFFEENKGNCKLFICRTCHLEHDEKIYLQAIRLKHDGNMYLQAIHLAHDGKMYLQAIHMAHDEKMYLQAIRENKSNCKLFVCRTYHLLFGSRLNLKRFDQWVINAIMYE